MRATDFVASYLDAWNHGDAEAVADHFTDDGVYVDVPENVRVSHDDIVESLGDFFAENRHRYELIGDILKGQNSVAFQYRMSPLERANRSKFAGVVRGAEFVTLHGDAAVKITDYYDVPGVARSSNVTRMASSGAAKRKYQKSGLSNEQLFEYKNRLEEVMTSQQLYLRSGLTLPTLAEELGCSVNHLSQVINSGFGMSFFDYLAQFRIDHAKLLLSTFDGQSGVVLDIAFSVGFNSNSAFYAAFKKCVGQTPAQYRKAQAAKSH